MDSSYFSFALEVLHTVVIEATVTNGRASLAVQMVSAEGTAITALTTRSVARGKSVVMKPVCRPAPRRLRLGLTLLVPTAPSTPIVS